MTELAISFAFYVVIEIQFITHMAVFVIALADVVD